MNTSLSNRLTGCKGFTLIEMLISMAIFIVIMIIAAQAFEKIISQSSVYSKMEESNIEGVVGLELMRRDLDQTGFGLPWGWAKRSPSYTGDLIDTDIVYNESENTTGKTLNDSTGGKPPRAFVGLQTSGAFNSAFIGVKATNVGRSKASQRWTHIPFQNFSSTTGRQSRPVTYSTNSPLVDDRVIVISPTNDSFSNQDTKTSDYRLIVSSTNNAIFSIDYKTDGSISDDSLPTNDQQYYLVYGVDNKVSPTTTLRMPFNRADFFIKVPSGVKSVDGSTGGALPSYCETSTGVLYKATVNQADGNYNYLPLLDCVADMQVVLGWEVNSSDGKLAYSTLPSTVGGAVSSTKGVDVAANIRTWLGSANDIREHLKVIKVYILAQEGKKDRNFTTPNSSISVGDVIADDGLTPKLYTFSENQKKYRWKLYRIIVRPKNLVSNKVSIK